MLPFFSQEKEEGMAVEIKDEMTVEVFYQYMFDRELFLSVSMHGLTSCTTS